MAATEAVEQVDGQRDLQEQPPVTETTPGDWYKEAMRELLFEMNQQLGEKVKEKKRLKSMARLEMFGAQLFAHFESCVEEVLRETIDAELKEQIKCDGQDEKLSKDEEMASEKICELAVIAARNEGILRSLGEDKEKADALFLKANHEEQQFMDISDCLKNNSGNLSKLASDVNTLLEEYKQI